MKVAEVARKANISPHVVRFYARTGLLSPGKDPHNGYKRFGQNELKRLRFIGMAQCLGYRLSEIGEMLKRLEQGGSPCDLMEAILNERLEETRGEAELLRKRLQVMERALSCLENGAWEEVDIDALCDRLGTVLVARDCLTSA